MQENKLPQLGHSFVLVCAGRTASMKEAVLGPDSQCQQAGSEWGSRTLSWSFLQALILVTGDVLGELQPCCQPLAWPARLFRPHWLSHCLLTVPSCTLFPPTQSRDVPQPTQSILQAWQGKPENHAGVPVLPICRVVSQVGAGLVCASHIGGDFKSSVTLPVSRGTSPCLFPHQVLKALLPILTPAACELQYSLFHIFL